MNYRAKAIASFETKLKLFIYNTVVNEGGNFDAEKFHNFSIGEELVKEYTTVYWQREKVYKIKEKSIDDIKEKSIDDIYKNMNALIADNKANIDALKNEYIINQIGRAHV